MSLICSYKKFKKCFYTRWFDETSVVYTVKRLMTAEADCVPSVSRRRSSSHTWQNALAFDHTTAQGFFFPLAAKRAFCSLSSAWSEKQIKPF